MADSVAIVFGASGGIGQSCVDALCKLNIAVVCCDVTKCDQIYSDRVVFQECDICKTEDVKGAFDYCQSEFGKLPSFVINCVGIIDEFDWEHCVDVNLGGSIRVMLTTVDRLGKQNGGPGGVLVMLSSILGLDAGPNVPVYTATKHGILGLVRSWMHPLHSEDHGVRMCCICPTAVDTKLLNSSLEGKMYKPEIMSEAFKQMAEEQGILSPAEIAAEIVRFLTDDDACSQVTRISKTNGVELVDFIAQPKV